MPLSSPRPEHGFGASFRRLTAAVLFATLVPRLAQRGLFLDGLTYAAIARNLAIGQGHVWAPSYTATLYPVFYEHPPLAFWLQSLWFRALGDHAFVERIYAATTAIVTVVVLALTWRRVQRADPFAREYDWLPALFWVAVPVVSWSVVGNMLETTMALFSSAAILAFAVALDSSVLGGIVAGLASGLCVGCAFLSKGPVGLFPLAAPVVFAFVPRPGRRVWAGWVGQWGAALACGLLLLAAAGPRASLAHYVQQQVLASVAGQRETSGSSLTIVRVLFEGVWLPMAGAYAVAVWAARTVVRPSAATWREAGAWTALGLAGTLPILLSSKQTGHYLVPAVPCFAIAAAMLARPTVAAALAAKVAHRRRLIECTSLAIVIAAVAAAWLPALERDGQRIRDLDAIANVVPQGTTLGICPATMGDWGLHAWFERRFRVSLGVHAQSAWFLKTRDAPAGCVPAFCRPITNPDGALVLMTCRS
ncbi:MAG: glycosyltransferase family 39 protein [Acidobacteriota bacterium]